MRISKLSVAPALATLLATATLASDSHTFYGSAGGWNVFVDSKKNTCFIEATDDFGYVVQMGLAREDRSVAYIGIFTKAETDIEADQKKGVAIKLGDNLYAGEATGMHGNIPEGYSGGYILTDDPEIVMQIQKQPEMLVFPENSNGFVLDLTGTNKAIEMGKKCNAEISQ